MMKYIFLLTCNLLIGPYGITKDTEETSAQTPESAARTLVDTLGKKVLTLFKKNAEGSVDREKSKEAFFALFREYFNVPMIAKSMLKAPWKKATPAERKQYVDLFEKDIVNSYFNLLETHYRHDDEWTVERAEAAKNDPNSFAVLSKILRGNGQNLEIKWLAFKKKIIDAIVEKISTSHSKRTEYRALWRQGGGTFPGFLKILQDKVSGSHKSKESPKS